MILVGIIGYTATGMVSVTALIPTFLGIPITLLGWLATNEKYRMHAMHAVILFGLAGFGGTVKGLLALPTLLSGGEVARPPAVIAQSIVAVMSAVFIVICVKSFIDARKDMTGGGDDKSEGDAAGETTES